MEQWENTEEFELLCSTYEQSRQDSFAVFLGCGANADPALRRQPPRASWSALVLGLWNLRGDARHGTFEGLCREHGDNWLALIEAVLGRQKRNETVRDVDYLLHWGVPRGDRDKRLSKSLLDRMPGLKAVVCFSAKIRDPGRYTSFERNPRIATIITTNYDFFFGAGWTRYQAFSRQWKVQTRFSLQAPVARQGCINYLHGYVPYELRSGSRMHARGLVLGEDDYKRAYRNPWEFAWRTLSEALEKFHFIFLGTSFSDPPLQEALGKLGGSKKHFALLAESDKRAVENAERTGAVHVVRLPGYAMIPAVLEKAYAAGLAPEELRRTGKRDKNAYWHHLQARLENPVRKRMRT